MPGSTRSSRSFPGVQLPAQDGAGPIDITLIAQFGIGADAQLATDPAAFLRRLRRIRIPPDCLFTVRFGGGTWHPFASNHAAHPALFALSCPSNELAGAMSESTRAQVQADSADIPNLTEVLPEPHWPSAAMLATAPLLQRSLQAAPPSLCVRPCAQTRSLLGPLRRINLRPLRGFVERSTPHYPVHSDRPDAQGLLAEMLDGFLRNRLVAPLRLRTSPLGCPVSSLLSTDRNRLFAGRFPVLDARVDGQDRNAEVPLGADDRHLRFRSSVRVQLGDDGSVQVSLGSRVQTHNRFGRLYMAMIDAVHRYCIAPALLQRGVEHALAPELADRVEDGLPAAG